MSCSSPAKARYKKLSPRHCGYSVPCLIRRASLKAGLRSSDPTLYTVSNLAAQTLFTDRSEGEHVRSFQLMAKRLVDRPQLANILIHKPGPLTAAPAEMPDYADVFRRGVLEVAELLNGVIAKPSRYMRPEFVDFHCHLDLYSDLKGPIAECEAGKKRACLIIGLVKGHS